MILRALLKVEPTKAQLCYLCQDSGLMRCVYYLADIIHTPGMLFNVLVFSTEVANSVPFCLCAAVGGWNNSLKLNWEDN